MGEVSLAQILDARDRRARKQEELLAKHGCPVVSFTMNIAGPVKKTGLTERAFNYGLTMLEKAFTEIKVIEKEVIYAPTGCEGIFSAEADAGLLKKVCVDIEEREPIGRLFDIDVICLDGKKLERANCRGCIVCGRQGRECAAGRVHSAEEISAVTDSLIREHFAGADALYIASQAVASLEDEVKTTPKPGLVDMRNSGSHSDMTADTFLKSANVLKPYFKECVILGQQNRDIPCQSFFQLLREAGKKAEREMFLSTGGVNTHKGIIYSMGILCAGAGRMWTGERQTPEISAILAEAARIADAGMADFEKGSLDTTGERLYAEKGISGIRGEAASGFESVMRFSLPVYRKAKRYGKSQNQAGTVALLHLISNVKDTNLYRRGGEEGAAFAAEYARSLLAADEYPPLAELERADEEFIKRNLSPGGCADLLAVTYFIDRIDKNEKRSQ